MKIAIAALLAASVASPATAQYWMASAPMQADANRPVPQPVAADTAMTPAAQPAAQSGEQELMALEDSWVKALQARDSATLNRIIAADWHGQNQSGTWYDRDAMVKSFLNGTDKITKANNHDVHVRFVGTDLAIVQGRDTEVSTHKGKSSSGDYSWTDVFQKRDGQWVAIASQNTPVTEK
jgi:uncharacterized protein (TIGR02246 family)